MAVMLTVALFLLVAVVMLAVAAHHLELRRARRQAEMRAWALGRPKPMHAPAPPLAERTAGPPSAHGPKVGFSGSKMAVDLPAASSLPPPMGDPKLDAVRRHMTLNQWDEARRQLQQVAYGMVDAPEHEKAAFSALMREFAARDPLFSGVLRMVMPLVREQPGMLQSRVYKHLPGIGPEEARYALYFGEQLGLLRRVKKGNSYRLYEPGMVVEADEVTKPKRSRSVKAKP